MKSVLASVAVWVCIGCGSNSEQGVPSEGPDLGTTDTVEQTIVYINEDGTTTQRVLQVPIAVAQAELQRKLELTAMAKRGETLPAPRLHPSPAPAATDLRTLYYGDVDEHCYGDDMWISSQGIGSNDVGTNTICFVKHNGGVGDTNLAIFFMPASANCAFNDYRVFTCANSFWAGVSSGSFSGPPGGARYFTAYQRSDNTFLNQWPHLSFN